MTLGSNLQQNIDTIYWSHGPCCAGCDYWLSITTRVGMCRASEPMSGADRIAMLGMSSISMYVGSGHAFTLADHHCGKFKDDFDWETLPLAYRKKVGAPVRPKGLS